MLLRAPAGSDLTHRSAADRRRALASCGAALWIGAALSYLLLEAITAAAVVPAYSYAHNYISGLGVPGWSPRAGVMNAAFYLQGILFMVGAVMIAGAPSPKTRLLLGFAVANAVGNVLVGALHSSNAVAGHGPGWHFLGATLAIVGGNAAVVAGSSVLRRAGASPAYLKVSVAVAAVGFLCLAAMQVDTSQTILPVGAWERGSVYSILIWQLFTGVYLVAGRPPGASSAEPAIPVITTARQQAD